MKHGITPALLVVTSALALTAGCASILGDFSETSGDGGDASTGDGSPPTPGGDTGAGGDDDGAAPHAGADASADAFTQVDDAGSDSPSVAEDAGDASTGPHIDSGPFDAAPYPDGGCPSGLHDCHGTCVSNELTSSCGISCTACPTPTDVNAVATCNGATCGSKCGPNYLLCGDGTCEGDCDIGNENGGCSSLFSYSPGELVGTPVTVSGPVRAVELGVTLDGTDPSTAAVLGLYTDVAGSPGALVAYTNSAAVSSSNFVVAVATPATITTGTYWIMAELSGYTSLCATTGTNLHYVYTSATYGNPLPNPFGAPQGTSPSGGFTSWIVAAAP